MYRHANEMQAKNWIGADKFYHCMAMCEAASLGEKAAAIAGIAGEVRELNQHYRHGDPKEECDADRAANAAGLRAGRAGQACAAAVEYARVIPKGLCDRVHAEWISRWKPLRGCCKFVRQEPCRGAQGMPEENRGVQQMKTVLAILLGALMATRCTSFGGDMIVRVSGSVPISGSAGKSGEQCELGMVSAETGEQSSTRNIPADFSTTMLVVAGPQPKHYYFVAECGDGRKFRSDTVTVSSRSSYSRNFNLGTLVENVP
nr:hypothetical protein [Pseudoxanthomonas broegbernensis]